jgi:RecJ-like exonuclease
MKLDVECPDCKGKGYISDEEACEKFDQWMQEAWQATSDLKENVAWMQRQQMAEKKLGKKMPKMPEMKGCERCCGIGRWPTVLGAQVLKFVNRYSHVMYKFEK